MENQRFNLCNTNERNAGIMLQYFDDLDVDGKIVLDISNSLEWSEHFLRNGALLVITVIRDASNLSKFRDYIHIKKLPILLLSMDMSCTKRFTKYLEMFSPDVVSMDCDGCEGNVLMALNDILRIPTDYIIKTSQERIYHELKPRMRVLGYDCVADLKESGNFTLLHFKRGDHYHIRV